jgi:hypothetical protein
MVTLTVGLAQMRMLFGAVRTTQDHIFRETLTSALKLTLKGGDLDVVDSALSGVQELGDIADAISAAIRAGEAEAEAAGNCTLCGEKHDEALRGASGAARLIHTALKKFDGEK